MTELQMKVTELSQAWEIDPHGERFLNALSDLQEYADENTGEESE